MTVLGDDTEGNITWGATVGVEVRFVVVKKVGLRGLVGSGLAADFGEPTGLSCCDVRGGAGWGWETSRRMWVVMGSTLGRLGMALRRRRWSL